jgi:hypothetical protein
MEEDLALGLCIIKVLCLIVIAMSVHKMAYSNEYFGTGGTLAGAGMASTPLGYGTANGVNYLTETQQSMFNNAEPPVFWNIGDLQAQDESLQSAAAQGVDSSTYGVGGQSAHQAASGFNNRSFNSNPTKLQQALGNPY